MYQIYTDFEPLLILKNDLTYLKDEGNIGAHLHLHYFASVSKNNVEDYLHSKYLDSTNEDKIKISDLITGNKTHIKKTISSCCSDEQIEKYNKSINKALLALKLDELRKQYKNSTDEKKANINESDWYMFLDHLCKNELTIDDIFKRLRIPKETNDKKI